MVYCICVNFKNLIRFHKNHQFNFKHFVTLGPISGLRVWGGDPYYQ